MTRAASILLASLPWVGLGLACKESEPPPAPVAPDRLQPDEPLLSTETAFGIPLPRELKVQARFAKSVHLAGRARAADLTEYFRNQVSVDHLEMSETQTTFPRARVRGGPSDKLYRIEITSQGGDRSQVIIEDITRPPTAPGLTEAQRWEQVGMNPDGTLKNRLQLK